MRNILRFRVVAMVLLALGLFAGTFANVGAQGTNLVLVCNVAAQGGDGLVIEVSPSELSATLRLLPEGSGLVKGDVGCTALFEGPATPVPTPTGTLVVSKFECADLEEATATVSDPVAFETAGGVDTSNCVADTAFFQVFADADFESEPVAEFNAGQASVDLAVGTGFALLEPEQNVFFIFDIAADAVTTITVLNPAEDKDGATPVPGDKDGDGKDDGGEDKDGDGGAGEDKDSNGDGVVDDKDGDAGADGDGGAAGEDGADGTDGPAGADGEDGAAGEAGVAGGKGVSVLPSTGQGTDAGTSGSAMVLLLGAMSLVALTAGFAWRQRRTA